jgi:Ca2+-binding EF-hand superfamily protein
MNTDKFLLELNASRVKTLDIGFAAFITLLVCLVCSIGSGQSYAQSDKREAWGAAVKPREPAAIIKMFDSNGDGQIDQIEYVLQIVKVFSDLDRNRDNNLAPSEIPGMDELSFAKADKDKDKKLSDYEFVTADSLQFETIDKNGDGRITEAEIAEHQKKSK